MTEFEKMVLPIFVGATVGSIFSLIGTLVGSWLTQGRERRQQLWRAEIDRILDLEERAGQLVELIGGYQALTSIEDSAAQGLVRLASDAGRFRRHKPIMQAIRDLHNGLCCLLDDKKRCLDFRTTAAEANSLYEKLLTECDNVTGKRRI